MTGFPPLKSSAPCLMWEITLKQDKLNGTIHKSSLRITECTFIFTYLLLVIFCLFFHFSFQSVFRIVFFLSFSILSLFIYPKGFFTIIDSIVRTICSENVYKFFVFQVKGTKAGSLARTYELSAVAGFLWHTRNFFWTILGKIMVFRENVAYAAISYACNSYRTKRARNNPPWNLFLWTEKFSLIGSPSHL
jgi:hypothetical protein